MEANQPFVLAKSTVADQALGRQIFFFAQNLILKMVDGRPDDHSGSSLSETFSI